MPAKKSAKQSNDVVGQVEMIVRAWRDPAFRKGLTAKQQAMIPKHPAGIIGLVGAALDYEARRRGYGPITRTYACFTCDIISCYTYSSGCLTWDPEQGSCATLVYPCGLTR
jgi:mersacidin/lichenicidin family type 2 lantibiotic